MAAVEISHQEPSWKRLLCICLFLAVSTLVVYWPITRHEFVNYDDTDYVTANPLVQAGFTAKGLVWAWQSEVARIWHPLTMLSHMLDCQLYGLKPGWHHLTSLLFHIANTVLLFLLLWKMTGAVWRSGFVAALFALHPLHVESVAWVAERKDVLSTFWFLLTLWAYSRYAEGQERKPEGRSPKAEGRLKSEGRDPGRRSPSRCHRFGYYWLALGLFALGLMSKPMLVTLPFVLLLLDYWPLRRFEVQGPKSKAQSPAAPSALPPHASRITHHASRNILLCLLLEKTPFLLLTAVSCIVTFRVQQSGGAMLDMSNLPIGARVGNALMSYVRYLGKMAWPEGLAPLYLRKTPWPAWEVGLAALALVASSAAAIRLVRRRPYLAVGWFWYVGTLIPVIGLVQVGMQTMADRYTYIPLIGISIILAWGSWDLADRFRTPVAGVGFGTAVMLAACMILTRMQVSYWQDSETSSGG